MILVGVISSLFVADATIEIGGWIAKKLFALMLWIGVILLLVSFGRDDQWVWFGSLLVGAIAVQARLSIRAHRRRRAAALDLEIRQLEAARRRADLRERSMAGRTLTHSKDAAQAVGTVAGVVAVSVAVPFAAGGHWVAQRVSARRSRREARDRELLDKFGR